MKKEITHLIQRMEILEEAFGIDISGLYATCEYRKRALAPSDYMVSVNFDITSLNNGKLKPFVIHANAYNSAEQLLGTTSSGQITAKYLIEYFPGFISVLLTFFHLDQEPARIRLYLLP